MRFILLLLLPVLATPASFSQTRRTDSISFVALNAARIRTDVTGMRVLGAWGLANTLVGITGAATAKQEEWQRFHQMNAAWGVVNLSIAGLSYLGARSELNKTYSNSRALHRYESTRRLYLLNAGLDGLYISTGIYLTERAQRGGSNENLFRGFGKSLILQGAGLLFFDMNMLLAHGRHSRAWYQALQSVCLTGNGIAWRYAIK